MNEHERIQKSLSCLQASDNTLEEVKEMINKTNYNHTHHRKFAIVAAVVAVVLALSVTAYALGSVIISQVSSWNGNTLIEHVINEDGEVECHVSYSADDVADATELRDGRLYFIINGEDIDITDTVSAGQPFNYDYADEQGNIHYFIIGGAIDNVGYAEYIKGADGKWLGGYSHNIITPDMETPEDHPMWYQVGRANINCPW